MKILRNLRNHSNLSLKMLAEKIDIDMLTISQYEMDIAKPSFKVLLKLSDIFGFSIDYLIHEGETNYPRNLRFMDLASKFDTKEMRNQRNQVEANASAFLSKIEGREIDIITDSFNEKLTNDFHKNLKAIRVSKKLSQSELGKPLGFSIQVVSRYEHNRYPPIPKLKKLSERLEVSAHCLATGRKLFFDFTDKHFQNTMLQADHFLPLEEQKMLIHLMETLLVNVGESV